MLQLGMVMNGFRILNVVSLFDKDGEQDSAVIMGRRDHDNEFVVAQVDQFQIDMEGPADHWGQGYYFRSSEIGLALRRATDLFLTMAELVRVPVPDRDEQEAQA